MLFDDSFKTILIPAVGLYKEKGSSFLGFAFPVSNPEEVKIKLNTLKKEHPKANHLCFAFRIGPDGANFRFSDDREPSGTAGKPILNQLLSAGLTDILLVVVRYFGGSLLGVPGLINAYKCSAADTLKHAEVIEKYCIEKYCVTFGFETMNELMGLLKSYNATIIRQEFTEDVVVDFEIRKSKADELLGNIKKIYKGNRLPEIKVLMP